MNAFFEHAKNSVQIMNIFLRYMNISYIQYLFIKYFTKHTNIFSICVNIF